MNVSEEILTRQWNAYLSGQRIPITVVTAMFLVIGTIGNSIVLLTYALEMKNFREERFFIPVLAAVDLLACTLTSSFIISMDVTEALFSFDTICRILEYLVLILMLCSTLLLLVIAVHRYMKVCRPLGKQMNYFWKKVAVLLTIILSVAIASPTLYFSGTNETTALFSGRNVTGEFCFLGGSGHPQEYIYFIAIFVINATNIIVISVLYTCVGVIIAKTFKGTKGQVLPMKASRTTNSETDHTAISKDSTDISTSCVRESTDADQQLDNDVASQQHRIGNSRVHTVKFRFSAMFMTISIFYIVSYLPVMTMMVTLVVEPNFFYQMNQSELNLYLFLIRCYIINNIVNPFIYGYFDYKFRDAMKRMFLRLYNAIRSILWNARCCFDSS